MVDVEAKGHWPSVATLAWYRDDGAGRRLSRAAAVPSMQRPPGSLHLPGLLRMGVDLVTRERRSTVELRSLISIRVAP
nr:unnamed protein product [Digitaria exilis]